MSKGIIHSILRPLEPLAVNYAKAAGRYNRLYAFIKEPFVGRIYVTWEDGKLSPEDFYLRFFFINNIKTYDVFSRSREIIALTIWKKYRPDIVVTEPLYELGEKLMEWYNKVVKAVKQCPHDTPVILCVRREFSPPGMVLNVAERMGYFFCDMLESEPLGALLYDDKFATIVLEVLMEA